MANQPSYDKCIAPDEISEEQLIAYADGEATEATVDHIRRCPYCARQAHAYAADQQVLRTLFHRMECPDAHTLGEYHLGLLSPADQDAVEAHLQMCPLCAAEIADLESFLEKVKIAPRPSPLSRLKRLVARRVPPSTASLAQQPAFALRGVTVAPEIYQAKDIKLAVGLVTDGTQAGRKMLVGFTTRKGESLASSTGARVYLKRAGKTVAVEQVDNLGNFVFSGLLSGEYELTLITDREQVVIETVVV